MADIFVYLLRVAGAFCTTILGPSTDVVDILTISRSGTTKWQRWGAPFILALRGAVEQYLQIEDLLIRGDEYLIAYKDSYVCECNMIAVAAAIIASVAMAALQLPSLIFSHWLSQAMMVFSLVTGLFSVYAACAQQRLITNLATPIQIRAWLSTPKYPSQGLGTHETSPRPLDAMEIRANTASVLTLTAPRTLLDHSIRFFVTGLGIYLTCAYTNGDIYTNTNMAIYLGNPYGSRNILIIFSVSVILGISLLISPSSSKNFQKDRSFPHINLARPVVGNAKGHTSANHSAADQERQTLMLQLAVRDAAHSHRQLAEALQKSVEADERVAWECEKLSEQQVGS